MDKNLAKNGKNIFLNLIGLSSCISNNESLRILKDIIEVDFCDINYFQNILNDKYLPNDNNEFLPLVSGDEKTCLDSALWFKYFSELASQSSVQIKPLSTFKVPINKRVKLFGFEEISGNSRDELVLVENLSKEKTIIKKIIVRFSKLTDKVQERNDFYADYFRLKEKNIFIDYHIFTNSVNKFSALFDENLMFYLYTIKQRFQEKVNVFYNENLLSVDEILLNLHNSYFVLNKYKQPEIFVAKKIVDDYCGDLIDNDNEILNIEKKIEKISLYKKFEFSTLSEFLNDNYNKYQKFDYFTENVNQWNDHVGECIKGKIIEINDCFKNLSDNINDINNQILLVKKNSPTASGGEND